MSTTQHQSLISGAKSVVKLLTKAGFKPHPGVIDGRGRRSGDVRIKVVSEPNRHHLIVSKDGVQEILLYGQVDTEHLLAVLKTKYKTVKFQ